MELVILCGIQCSGKTTFFQERFLSTHGHISLDVLGNRSKESNAFQHHLESGMPVVIDNTNANRKLRAEYIAEGKRAGYSIVGFEFQTPIALAIKRNKVRNSQRTVLGLSILPDAAIFTTVKKLDSLSYEEGFDNIYVVRSDRINGFKTTIVLREN